ncbi:hypothetical protein HMI54_012554 [Coelomomyces lativittatus]|nr:hypothetical protein HMI54_012554 [Coelomomyces lativittatus]
MLRRTKLEKADDLGLPPRHIVVRHVFFNEEEKDFYTSLYSDSKRQFATYVAAGTVLNHYANIFELLTKMRQAASHPDLVVSKFKQKLHDVCGICHDVAELPVIAKCKHVFCREDARNYIASCISPVVLCPICFSPFVVSLDDDEVILEKPVTGIVNKINMDMWRSSSKIEALVEELYRLKQENYTIKSIVFSQYVSFLELIHWRLRKANFECVKLDGRMSLQQRDSVIQAFMTNPNVTVFLISLKAGGVALNLTEASQVFIMDPWCT